MNGKHKELATYCGLYCGDCIRYKSKALDLAVDPAGELRFHITTRCTGLVVHVCGCRALFLLRRQAGELGCWVAGNIRSNV